MKFLIDTHAFLWFLQKPEFLPPHVLTAIEEAGEDAFVSMVSLWEISIKASLNKLKLPAPYETLFPSSVTDSGLSLLPIEVPHLGAVGKLPHHHRDPFDRLLIAQAQVEGLTLISIDSHFPAYDVPLLW